MCLTTSVGENRGSRVITGGGFSRVFSLVPRETLAETGYLGLQGQPVADFILVYSLGSLRYFPISLK